jgi:hypothetical protein
MEIFQKNPSWGPKAILHNVQIPIFDVPYKYTIHFLWVFYGLITYLMKFQ